MMRAKAGLIQRLLTALPTMRRPPPPPLTVGHIVKGAWPGSAPGPVASDGLAPLNDVGEDAVDEEHTDEEVGEVAATTAGVGGDR